MATGPSTLDWSLVQAFLAVAEQGSLSAAARVLGASQPTLGRQIKAMEDQLGVELFHRHEKGFSLTETGTSLLASAQAMRASIHEIELHAAGKGEALEGPVRITASVMVSVYLLPPVIATLRMREPSIAIELCPTDASSNLYFREADIAVRMYRPSQLDLVTQYLGDLTLSIFAAKRYVERRGIPKSAADLLSHDVVGFDRDSQIIEGFRQSGYTVTRDWFKVRVDHQVAYFALVRAGCGIGFGQTVIGRRDPDLVEIPLDLTLPRLPVWLTAHEAIRQTPRVQRVWDLLVTELRELCDHEEGAPPAR